MRPKVVSGPKPENPSFKDRYPFRNLQEARQEWDKLQSRLQSALAAKSAAPSAPTNSAAPQPVGLPPAPSRSPGEPRRLSEIRQDMLKERSSDKLARLYEEWKQSEAYYGRFSAYQ
jgi:hypothetical protein